MKKLSILMIAVAFGMALLPMCVAKVQAVSLPGDLNHDGNVDLQDFVLLAQAFGSHSGDVNWNAEADLAAPLDVISLTDAVTLAKYYGS
jgi:hypothetical protein